MEKNCFYCDYEIEEGKQHFVAFFKNRMEQEKPLCDVCYAEWLEGLKE
ncbi:hypothetical protein WD019_04750 [Fictibacillus sp. Mic-4]